MRSVHCSTATNRNRSPFDSFAVYATFTRRPLRPNNPRTSRGHADGGADRCLAGEPRLQFIRRWSIYGDHGNSDHLLRNADPGRDADADNRARRHGLTVDYRNAGTPAGLGRRERAQVLGPRGWTAFRYPP